jgi:serine phosphatase RsbU (regulator of sigma subunit)
LFIGFSTVLGSLVSSAMLEIERQHQRLAEQQERLHLENARIAGELAAARSIQMASLPRAEQVLAGETRFQLAAILEPAREVGGDFYDFYMLDARHLFFILGDVSGRGVSASLFMATTKALTKQCARELGAGSLAAIVAAVAREIGRENPDGYFVSLVAGLFDTESGQLVLCNAGHDAPWCQRRDGALERLAPAGGPPLGGLGDFVYGVETLALQAGDTLLLHTDGLNQATNGAGDFYGNSRLEGALVQVPLDASPGQVLEILRQDVRGFIGSAETADDLALLALRRN